MMTQQPYYGAGEYDPFHRPSQHRALSSAAYYERPAPYAYYNDQPRQELRSEYEGRPVVRATIQEPESENTGGSARRRIAVACSRCRRRKIKCSGDPGDGTGCQACRASGADTAACTFNRVSSELMHLVSAQAGVEAFPQIGSSAIQSGSYATDASGSPSWLGHHHQPQSRPSLPTLHTRSSFLSDYDHYESSPVDQYTYGSATIPRQDSFSSSYGGAENYRSWSTTTAPMSTPVTTGYWEQQPPYSSFGALQAPSYSQVSNSRLPSVTMDTFSSLNNMGSLHSSLPPQTAQERRLPVPVAPYTVHYPQAPYPSGEQLPVIRPGSYSEPRVHLNGIHSRNAMPWSPESASSGSRPPLAGNIIAPINGLPGLPMLQPQQQHTTRTRLPEPEPVLGYLIGANSTLPPNNSGTSPEISPTSGPGHESFSSTASSSSSSTSMAPPLSNFRYAPTLLPATSNITPTDERSSHRESAAAASLYSFSTDKGERSALSSNYDHQVGSQDMPGSSGHVDYSSGGLRHPQPQSQHRASVEALRRQSSFDQPRAATTNRMSVSNLNGRYG